MTKADLRGIVVIAGLMVVLIVILKVQVNELYQQVDTQAEQIRKLQARPDYSLVADSIHSPSWIGATHDTFTVSGVVETHISFNELDDSTFVLVQPETIDNKTVDIIINGRSMLDMNPTEQTYWIEEIERLSFVRAQLQIEIVEGNLSIFVNDRSILGMNQVERAYWIEDIEWLMGVGPTLKVIIK